MEVADGSEPWAETVKLRVAGVRDGQAGGDSTTYVIEQQSAIAKVSHVEVRQVRQV